MYVCMLSRWGSQPQWSVTGETFPVGCRFSNLISGSKFFSVNPDRRRRLYSSLHGCYTPQCGLKHVTMSWGGPEYLYNVLCCQCGLPAEALFCIRHQRFQSLTGMCLGMVTRYVTCLIALGLTGDLAVTCCIRQQSYVVLTPQ